MLNKLTIAAGSLRSWAERPRVLVSESSKGSSNSSVSSRLSLLFAHGHNTCRATLEFIACSHEGCLQRLASKVECCTDISLQITHLVQCWQWLNLFRLNFNTIPTELLTSSRLCGLLFFRKVLLALSLQEWALATCNSSCLSSSMKTGKSLPIATRPSRSSRHG